MLSFQELRTALLNTLVGDSDSNTNPASLQSYFSSIDPVVFTQLSSLQKDLKQELALCAFCSRIGVQHSPDQTINRQKVLNYQIDSSKLTTEDALLSIESILSSSLKINSSKKPFLSGQKVSDADIELFSLVYPLVSYVLLPEQRANLFPTLTQFSMNCLNLDAQTGKLGLEYHHMLGMERIGNQIDCSADSRVVRQGGDYTRTLNAGFKKQQTQRQKEKAAKGNVEKQHANLEKLDFKFKNLTIGQSVEEKINSVNTLLKECDAGEVKFILKHKATPTMTDLMNEIGDVDRTTHFVCKNLFLRGKSKDGNNNYFLLSVPGERMIDYKQVTQFLKQATGVDLKGDVRQAKNEDLLKVMKVPAGMVTPFGLVNDPANKVILVLDENMMQQERHVLYFHPLTNEATVGVSPSQLNKFVEFSGRRAILFPTNVNLESKSAPVKEETTVTNNVTVDKLNWTNEEYKQNLQDKLKAMGVDIVKEDITTLPGFDPKARPHMHSTHNLLLKGKKTGDIFLVSMRQSVNVNLKDLAKVLNEKELRFADIKKADNLLCQKTGCVTLLSLFGNQEGKVRSVVDKGLFTEGTDDDEKMLRICIGCEDPLDHSQHLMVDMKVKQVKELLKENKNNQSKDTIYIDLK